ncbi:glutamyl-tRNA reductase [Halobellus captivus]|uniref:glutamyl-tRNA reductase n=1 Tax=Halobellus captivus TaxID=2592614 RepID=UPI0011A874AD|nr:glutamyl-tRNA reductase [Halobellus captivus]
MDAGVIRGSRVSHERASVEDIEDAACGDVRAVVETLLDTQGVSEAFAIQTCNRAEAYVVADTVDDGRRALERVHGDASGDVVVEMGHEESLRHLIRVAAGLESLVLGEDQILGQFKRAMEIARNAGALGPTFETGLTKAVHVGERARTETAINEGATSIGSAAARLAEAEIDLNGTTALVVGAGEMGKLAAEALSESGVAELIVANRTVPNAERIVDQVAVPATAIPLESLNGAVADASVVVTATSTPEYLLESGDVNDAGETLFIDLAQPRDVHPEAATVEEVVVRDIDALESVTEQTKEDRKAAAAEVEAMIDEEFDRLLDAYKRRQADEAISTMYEAAERVKAREVDTALTRLEAQGELTDEQRETVEAMADALVGQLLSAPTKSLRDAATEDDWATIQTAMTLFNPEFGPSRSSVTRRPGREAEGAEQTDSAEGTENAALSDAAGLPKSDETASDRSDEELLQYALESVSDD